MRFHLDSRELTPFDNKLNILQDTIMRDFHQQNCD